MLERIMTKDFIYVNADPPSPSQRGKGQTAPLFDATLVPFSRENAVRPGRTLALPGGRWGAGTADEQPHYEINNNGRG
jgi:hypothetical protein